MIQLAILSLIACHALAQDDTIEKPAENPAEASAEKPAEKPADKPAEKPAEEPEVDPPQKPADAPAAKESKPAEAKKPQKKDADSPEEPPLQFDPAWTAALTWRSIGPAAMGGRIVDLEVVPSDPTVFFAATASGGLFKTTNNGTTFSAMFDQEATVSIGDVAVAASNPDIVWVGTGENNARNSVSWGNGVYKSIDGGKTWSHMGLDESFQIGRIAIHPTNPDVVYVGALGRLWGPSESRGVYKTTDGGKTWSKVLHVDDKTGCTDIVMNPAQPDTLLAAMYERKRDALDGGDPVTRWGPGSGLHKTADGGATWTRITDGLPDRPLGRIGLCYFEKDPTTVFAIVESDKIGTGPVGAFMGINGGADASKGVTISRVIADGPAAKAGLKDGDVVLEVDGKEVAGYEAMLKVIRQHQPDEKSPVKIRRGEEELEMEITWGKRPGNVSSRPFSSSLGGQKANAQDEQGPDGVQTGGVYKSTDGGDHWSRVNSLNPRPFYFSQIRVDPTDDAFVYVLGIRFHYSKDGGKTFETAAERVHPDHHALWIDPRDGRHLILGCDGGVYASYDRGKTWDLHDIMAIGQFYDVGVDMRKPYNVYGGLQDNGCWGGPSRTRGQRGPMNADWFMVGWGDGFVCRADPNDPDVVYHEAQFGRVTRTNVRTGARAGIYPKAEKDKKFRSNWKTPFQLSRHNSKIFYYAGNYVFRSLDRGADLRRISPEIARTDRGSATALAESPRDPDVLYVGTDDGALWVTRDGGHQWQDLTDKVGLPTPLYASSIEASQYEAGRVYVAFDGHRSDDDAPHLMLSNDFGETWKPIVANLPTGSTHCLREDVANSNLLYCGTEFAIWASLDRGGHWTKINNNLPTVAVHEIAVHPRDGEIVAATHGRSLWILDVTPLRGLTGEVARSPAYLFGPKSATLWGGALGASQFGNRRFVGENPGRGAPLYFHLAQAAEKASIEICDITGQVLRRWDVERKPGLHRSAWDLRRDPPRAKRGQRSPRGGLPVKPGTYLARLVVDDHQSEREISVEADPAVPIGNVWNSVDLREFPDN